MGDASLARSEPAALSLVLGGREVLADPAGVAVLAAEATLLVADLHLEKGSAFARHGALLPPYDTRQTLERLGAALARWQPRRVVCLGDSLHDEGAGDRLDIEDRRSLEGLMRGREWIWIEGNHDGASAAGLGGEAMAELRLGGLVLRHEALAGSMSAAEVSGHYHPVARLRLRTGSRRLACFAEDGRRLVLPAFGAYTGGLNVLDPALKGLFGKGLRCHVLTPRGLRSFGRRDLLAE